MFFRHFEIIYTFSFSPGKSAKRKGFKTFSCVYFLSPSLMPFEMSAFKSR
jgi:hypothetical protein